MPWRWPRILAALMAGVMLAVAGCIIQRLTGNPMASPEVLGISSGAAFGVVLMLFLVPGMPSVGYCLPEARRGGDTADYYDSRRARFLAATDVAGGMALSTAFTMLLMMLVRAATRGWRKY